MGVGGNEEKTRWWGQLGTVCSKPSRQTESGEGVSVDCKSLLWFIRLLSLTLVGVNGGCHACTLALLLSLCLGNGASPPGPKFGISILCSNGPPFATCQRKIGGFVPARVPPAERGPVFLSCSMTPLFLTVDFLSLFPGRPLHLISSVLFFSKIPSATTNHLK